MKNEELMVLLGEWDNLKKQYEEIKKREFELRKVLCQYYFPDPNEGTNKVEIGNGWVLKGVVPYTYKVIEEKYKRHKEEFTTVPKEIFRIKMELSKTVYNKMYIEQRMIVDKVLLVTPGSMQLEITPPK